MTYFQVNIKAPLSVEVIFSKEPLDLGVRQEINTSQDFLWDFTDKNIESIFEKIIDIDGTVARKINRDGSLKWDIDLTEYPHISNRFRCLIPHVCRSQNLESVLYPFQKEGREWLLQSPTRILADDMGLGKSIQSIAAIEEIIFSEKLDNILVISPNTLVTNWELEFRKWCPLLSFFSLTSVYVDDENFTKNKIKNNNVIITTYSSLNKLLLTLGDEYTEFDLIVADEAHKLRNNTSKINRAFRSIARKKTWLLTGTPLERDEEDIKNILVCLEPNSASAFDQRGDNIIFKSNLSEVSLRRLKRDVLKDLPAVQRVPELLEMSSSQKSHYQGVLKEMQRAPSEERIGFLSKLSYSAIVAEDGSSCKFDRAIEICEVAKETNKKVIIFSNFNGALRLLSKRLSHQKIGSSLLTGEVEKQARDRHISRFKTDDKITSLLCNSSIGSEGLTLTEASIVVFLNEWWNPSSNRQAEDRVNRIGQMENVLIYILRSKNTIDDNLASILEGKVDLEKEFLDRLVVDIEG